MSPIAVNIFLIVCVVLYALALLFIFIYSLTQGQLVWRYLHRKKPADLYQRDETFKPVVTVQLPLYNERYVVERLIDAVCRIRHPRDKFEVQILDDSNDETTELAEAKVKEWNAKGVDVKLIRRTDRSGFKAGALKYGHETVRGEFIAIFDADFIPGEDFLEQTLPYFTTSNVGMGYYSAFQIAFPYYHKRRAMYFVRQLLYLL